MKPHNAKTSLNLCTGFKKIWRITQGQIQDNKGGVHCFIT